MAGDEPPYLPVGTDVSAKYRGAFCEAKVKKIVRSVKCKVTLKDLSGSVVVTDDNVKGPLKVGVTVEIKHPESGLCVEGVLSKLTDCSMYTVVFDDADERTLRRTQLCLKGEKHFIESETLDNLPLSHPEHFGTPVMQASKEKKKRRSLRDTEEEESEVSSSESELILPKRAVYKGKNQDLVGKVMYIEVGDKKKMTAVPVLVALPDAHSTELRTKDHLLVRSFKDSKYLSVSRRELKEFVREVALKNEDKAMKNAMEKALLYFENGEVPAAWNKEELLGYETEVDDGEGEDSSDDEPSEEKDRFVAQLYKFMDDRGTPINKAPSIGSKDLNLYKLFKVVQNIGGYNRVTNMMRWRLVYSKMNLPQSYSASSQIKNAYKKYLHAFEDFYRKLGSTMGTISRPGRSRHNSGRSLYRDNQRKPTDIILSPKERKTPVKEEHGKDTPERCKLGSDMDTPARGQLDSVKKELMDSFDFAVSPASEDRSSESGRREEGRERTTRAGRSVVKEEPVGGERDEDKPTEEKKDSKEGIDNDSGKNTRKRVRSAALSQGRKSPRGEELRREEERAESPDVGKKDVAEKKEPADKKESGIKEVDKKDTRRKPKDKEPKIKVEVDKDDMPEEGENLPSAVSDGTILPLATKLKVKYGRGRNQKIYEAKVVEVSTEDGGLQYLVHYAGWNMRYDEWVKPDRIVQIVDKPEPSKTSAKSKPATPQSPKGSPSAAAASKKRGRPSSVTPTRSTGAEGKTPGSEGKPQSSEGKSHNRSPAPGSNSNKSRSTRSTSLEIPVQALQHKSRRTRRSSGYADSPDVLSHASDEESELSLEDDVREEEISSVPPIESVKVEPRDTSSTLFDSITQRLGPEKTEPEKQASSSAGGKVAAVSSKPSTATPNKSAATTPSKPSAVSSNKLSPQTKVEVRLEKSPKADSMESPSDKGSAEKKEAKSGEEGKVKKFISSFTPCPKVENTSLLSPVKLEKPIASLKEEKSHVVPSLWKAVDRTASSTNSDPVPLLRPVMASAILTPASHVKPLPGREPVLHAKSPELRQPAWVESRAESGSDEESSKVPEIVKESETKLPHVEAVEFLKPPTLEKAVSLTELPDIPGVKEGKHKTKKGKEGKRGRPPLHSQTPPRVTPEDTAVSPACSKEKSVDKEKKKETESLTPTAEVKVEPALKRDRPDNIVEKPGEEKKDVQEVQAKDENEKKKVKKKLKKKQLEEKLSLNASELQDGEVLRKDGSKKVKDGSKKEGKVGKSGKGDKLSKKEKKAKKKNKHKESADDKIKESEPSELANENIRKLVAEVLRVGPSMAVSDPVTESSSSMPARPSNPVASTSTVPPCVLPDAPKQSTPSQPPPSHAIPPPVRPITPPQVEPAPVDSKVLMDNTPPTTPEREPMEVPVAPPPDNLQLSIDRAVSRTMAEADLATEGRGSLPAGGESPSGGEGSTTSNESGSSGNIPGSESSGNDLVATKRKRDSEDSTPSKKKKRSSKRQEKKHAGKTAGSDSEEAANTEIKEIARNLTAIASPSRTTSVSTHRSPRPSKYNFNLEDGKYLEGEKRIGFLVEKISEIRKIYMNLKSEVACLDRRRKRHKRKERESESV